MISPNLKKKESLINSNMGREKLSILFEKDKIHNLNENLLKHITFDKEDENFKKDFDGIKTNSLKNSKERFFLNISYQPKTDFKKMLSEGKDKAHESNSNLKHTKNEDFIFNNVTNNNAQEKDETNCDFKKRLKLNQRIESVNNITPNYNKLLESENIFKNSKGENFNTLNLKAEKIDVNYKTFNVTFNIPNSFATIEAAKNNNKFEKKLLNKNFSKTIDNMFMKNSEDKNDIIIKQIKKEFSTNNEDLHQIARLKHSKYNKISYYNNENYVDKNIKNLENNKNNDVELRKKIIHEVKKEYKELINESLIIQKKMNEKSNNKILEKIEKYKYNRFVYFFL